MPFRLNEIWEANSEALKQKAQHVKEVLVSSKIGEENEMACRSYKIKNLRMNQGKV